MSEHARSAAPVRTAIIFFAQQVTANMPAVGRTVETTLRRTIIADSRNKPQVIHAFDPEGRKSLGVFEERCGGGWKTHR